MERDKIIKIKDMIGKIKDKQILKEVFFLAQTELQSIDGNCKYSHNDNGIFFDLKVLSEPVLLKIEELLKNTLASTNTESETISYNIYYNDENK